MKSFDLIVEDKSVSMGHVVDFDLGEDGVITACEKCDYYFTECMNRDEFRQFINALENLYEKMDAR